MKIQEKSVKLNPNYVKINILKKIKQEEFLGGPAVKDWFSNAEGTGSIPGGETKIPHAIRHGQINKQEKKKSRVGGREYMYTYSCFTSLYSRD